MVRKIFFFVIFTFWVASTYAAIADLALTDLWPTVEKTGNYVSPKVVIKNVGGAISTSPNISVKVVIKDGSGTEIYSEIKEGSYSILRNAGDSTVFTFPVIQITTAGSYTLTANLTYADDDNTSNNTLTNNLLIKDFSYPEGSIFGYNVAAGDYQGHLVRIDLNNHLLPVTDLDVSMQYSAGDYFRGVIQAIKTGTSEIYWIDSDGNTYLYGKIRGVTGSIYGFTYTQGDIFVMSFDNATNKTNFYKVDTATLIANIMTSYTMGAMGLAANDNGGIYVIDYLPPDASGNYSPGSLYTLGTTGGALSKIGTLNKIFYGLSDYSVERTTGDLYGVTPEYDQSGTLQGFYVVKINTANAEVEELYGHNIDLQLGFVALIPGVSIEMTAVNEDSVDFSVYPNPSSGVINITNMQGARLSVSDLTGRIVSRRLIKSSNEQIDLSSLDKGIYLIKVEQNNRAFVKKIILK